MLRNMKIGKKLLLTFFLTALISSIGGIVGFFVMRNMNNGYESALANYGFAQGDVGQFSTEFNNSRLIVRDILSNSTNIQTKKTELNASNNKINQYLSNIEPDIINDDEKKYFDNIKNNISNFFTVENQIVDLAQSGDGVDAYTLMSAQGTPTAQKIVSDANELLSMKTDSGDRVEKQLTQQETFANITILAVIGVSVVISILIAFSISRSISKPVKQLVEAAERMEQGDLQIKLAVKSKNEIGILAEAFTKTSETIFGYIRDISTQLAKVEQGDLTVAGTMAYQGDFIQLKKSLRGIIEAFNDTLVRINQSAEQVASGSDQVSGGAQALAQGATEQASSVEELSASISDISEKVSQNAENINKGMLYIEQAQNSTLKCNEHMDKMLSSMEDIRSSSNEISKIIKVIDDIAFQTNILALNAAVEAARAGEAGKGFAVVADEVRNLAGKSASAAKQTTDLIESAIVSVKEGSQRANETAKSLRDVENQAQQVTEMMQKVDKASNEQAGAIAQITQGIEQISNVVQTNSATAEESAAASEELSGQAQVLKSLTERFKFRNSVYDVQKESSAMEAPKKTAAIA